MTLDTPHTMPWLNQLVMMWALAPEPNSTSPSDDVMLRDTVRFFRFALTSAQINAVGVRDMVQPPTAT